MPVITYLLQVSACTAIFYVFYYLLLRRLTFFTINRWYLIITLTISFVIPVITIPVHQQYVPNINHMMYNNQLHDFTIYTSSTPTKDIISQPISKSIDLGEVLKLTYIMVTAVLWGRLMFIIGRFFTKVNGRATTRLGKVKVITGDKGLNNGSFLNYIFLNDDSLSADEIEQIIAHELLHVRLYHSVDRLMIKLAQVLLWFNPVVYLYARSVETNHEFEVDREMGRSTDKGQYADLLLHLSVAGRGTLYHSFSKVPVKHRIIMLFTKPTNHMKKIIYLLVLPVVMISCLAFAKFELQQPLTKIWNESSALTKNTTETGVNKSQATEEKNLIPKVAISQEDLKSKVLKNRHSDLTVDTGKKQNLEAIDRKMEWIYSDGLSGYPIMPGIFFKRTEEIIAGGEKRDKMSIVFANGRASVYLKRGEKIAVTIDNVLYTMSELGKLPSNRPFTLAIKSSSSNRIMKDNIEYYVPFAFSSIGLKVYGQDADTVKIGNNIVLKRNKSGV